MNVLVVINDQRYGSERPYDALRLAKAPTKRDDVELRVFLLGDAVACAIASQKLPNGNYHLDHMLNGVLHRRTGSVLRHPPRGPRGSTTSSSSKAPVTRHSRS